MVFNKYLLLIGVFMLSLNTFANVTVTSAGNLNLCVGTTYTTMGKITIAEGAATDFGSRATIQTYEINAPSNFEFNPGNGSVSATGADISFSALTVTATKITLYYLLNATATTDKFELTNIQIRATNPSGAQNIVRTGGDASQTGNDPYTNVHASVTASQAYVSLNASQNVVCSNASDITLNGSPGGGSYSGSAAIAGNTFKPSASGTGMFIITYTANQNGCSGTDTVHITVKPIPSVTFFGLASSYCSGDADVPLTGFPSGGTFSGSGIVNNTFFKPSNAGVGNNKTVTYSYTSNGCTGTTTLSTNVNQAPSAVTISLIPSKASYIDKEDSILITGTQSINIPAQGSEVVTGNGIVLGADGKYRFFPNVVGEGTYPIIRTITSSSNGCKTSFTQNIQVGASISGTISGLGTSYCQSSNDVIINVNNDTGPYYLSLKDINGDYQLVSPVNSPLEDSDPNNGQAVFKPSLAQVGEYKIEFKGQLTGLISRNVIIEDVPVVDVKIKNQFCSNDPSVTIPYSAPVGGVTTFSGNGVTNGIFNPNNIDGNDTIYYQYIKTSNGCKANGYVVTEVFKAPENVAFSGLSSSYCSSDPYAILTPDPTIIPSGTGKFDSDGGGLQINSNGQTIFSPSAIVQTGLNTKNYTISYVYTTSNGCSEKFDKTIVVNKVPEVNLNNLSSAYCFSKDTVVLSGSPGANSGTFSIAAIAPTVATPSMLYNKNRFIVSKTTPGIYYLTYTYTDPTSHCTSYDTDTTIIRSLPNTSFTNLDTSYCVSNASVTLYGSPTGGTYSSLTASLTGTVFKPSDVGKHSIIYTYADEFGCSASMTKNTTVYGIPMSTKNTKPQFKLSTVCENDFITLSDLSSQINTDNGAASFIKSCYWKIDNIIYSSDFKNDTTLQLSAGEHKITYQLTTDKNCLNTTVDSAITIGSYPETNFTWDKICNKENTKFYNTSSIAVGNITNLVWDFGDGKPKVNLNLPQYKGDTSHTFTNVSNEVPSTYSVILTAKSDYGCLRSYTQNVFILPAQEITSSKPYSSDFEINNGGWIADSPIENLSSWKLGKANKSVIKSNSNVWVTSLDGSFNPEEISYVYSPCFTMTDITKPMIHLDIWSSMINNVAGANLQYAVDGATWKTLGRRNVSGVNWYNNTGNIVARPSGAELDQNGWTDTNTVGWKNARHTFDKELGNNKNIRFRIAFAGTEETKDGFAFDNVWIGDRTRLILAEHFTNNSSQYTKVENITLNDLVTDNLVNNEPKDIVKLEYHTAFPGPDQMNARNIDDPGARALYYGITQIPYTSIDGSYFNGSALKVDTNMIHTRSLYDPAFDIVLNPVVTDTTITGDVQITNKIPVHNTVTVYISLLERFVNNVPGRNGETSYQWVHSKFLPNAGGTSFAPDWWSAQPTQKVNLSWKFPSNYFYDKNKLAMIAFVQNNVTNEIYQTAYKGIGATVSTGVFDPAESTSTVSLYPNPADDNTTVVLNGKLSGKYNWLIVDEMGRVVDEGTLTDGTDGFTINTTNYANGFYTLRLSNSNAGVKTQKFVVIH